MKKVYILIVFLLLFSIAGCSKKKPEVIIFDETYPNALTPNVKWALVNDPYIAFKEDPDWNSETIGYCRKGEILQVERKTITSNGEEWYCFEQGWLPSGSISVFSNRYKALTAASSL